MTSLYSAGGALLSVNVEAWEAHVDGQLVPLTRAEFVLLATLCDTPGRVVSRDALGTRVSDSTWGSGGHTVEVLVSRVRAKLGESASSPAFIETVRGVGYRFAGATVDGAGTVFAVLAADLMVRSVSGDVSGLLGVSAEQVVGTYRLVPSGMSRTELAWVAGELVGLGVTEVTMRVSVLGPDGVRRPVRVRVQVVGDGDGDEVTFQVAVEHAG